MVFGPFWSENGYAGMHFVHFGLESGICMIFEGTTGVSERISVPFQFQMNKNEVEICEFEIHVKKNSFFALTVACYSLLLL